MRIIQLTPGTGNFHCGTCLRDHALMTALRRCGHVTWMVPMYLPLVLDGEINGQKVDGRVAFGGINVYLQQKWRWFRKTPWWLDSVFDRPWLLRRLAKWSGMTSARSLGELTISMLQGEDGRQTKELDKLISWLGQFPQPDLVCLSNVLLAGLARQIKRRLGIPVVCTLQGEDSFLDTLDEPQRGRAWRILSQRADDIDSFIAPSKYYGDAMTGRLEIATERVNIVYNGIELDGIDQASSQRLVADAPPVLGYLARLCHGKGLGTLVDAFMILKKNERLKDLKLHIAGAMTKADEPFVRSLRARLEKTGLSADVTITVNLDREAKWQMLGQLTVFSVPATYGEAFGLYVLEALAAGVPVVQPRHGAFEELLGLTGGGILCDPDDPRALAEAIEALLVDEDRRAVLAAEGRRNVLERFSADQMARRVAEVYERVASRETEMPPDGNA